MFKSVFLILLIICSVYEIFFSKISDMSGEAKALCLVEFKINNQRIIDEVEKFIRADKLKNGSYNDRKVYFMIIENENYKTSFTVSSSIHISTFKFFHNPIGYVEIENIPIILCVNTKGDMVPVKECKQNIEDFLKDNKIHPAYFGEYPNTFFHSRAWKINSYNDSIWIDKNYRIPTPPNIDMKPNY